MNKSLKQRISALVAAIFLSVIFLCSCSSDDGSSDKNILPELIIGSDYYHPFIYRADNGDFAGIDVELATEICRHIGYKPKFVPIQWSDKKAYLARGEVDCLWGCFTLTGRENDYAWTLPYMNSRQVVAVQENSGIESISDLENKRVAVQSTTKPDEIFSGVSGMQNLKIPKLKELNCFPNMTYTFAAINNGYVDAIAGHEVALKEYMKTSFVKLRILDESLLNVQIGVAFLKNTHSDLIEKINNTFLLLKNNGYLASLVLSYGLNPDVYVIDYKFLR